MEYKCRCSRQMKDGNLNRIELLGTVLNASMKQDVVCALESEGVTYMCSDIAPQRHRKPPTAPVQ